MQRRDILWDEHVARLTGEALGQPKPNIGPNTSPWGSIGGSRLHEWVRRQVGAAPTNGSKGSKKLPAASARPFYKAWLDRQLEGRRRSSGTSHKPTTTGRPPTTSVLTSMGIGFCNITRYEEGGRCAHDDAQGSWRAESLTACASHCTRCSQCRYISFSSKERDCSWFGDCPFLHSGAEITGYNASHQTYHVSSAA